jgi:hypothetical protein
MLKLATGIGLAIGSIVALWGLSVVAPVGLAPSTRDTAAHGGQRAPVAQVALLSIEGNARQSQQSRRVRIAGAECPTGSGSYCSDELPYCCPGISVGPYCAADVNGCTQ